MPQQLHAEIVVVVALHSFVDHTDLFPISDMNSFKAIVSLTLPLPLFQ